MAFDPLDIGDSIVLTIVQAEDAEEIFNLVDGNRDYLRKWFPWVDLTKGVQDTLTFVERARKQDQEKNGIQCCVRLEGKTVGMMGFDNVDHNNRKCEVGYWIAESYQGRGIMTKCVKALTDYAFSEWQMNRVEIHSRQANTRSRAVAERLGFEYEGTLREIERVSDRYVDHAVYSMLRRDWHLRRDFPK